MTTLILTQDEVRGLLDMEAERKRLGREKDKVERELETTSRKLNNDAFLNNAPDAVIAKVRKEHQQLLEKRARLEKTLDQLNP